MLLKCLQKEQISSLLLHLLLLNRFMTLYHHQQFGDASYYLEILSYYPTLPVFCMRICSFPSSYLHTHSSVAFSPPAKAGDKMVQMNVLIGQWREDLVL
jgi:hypothetical protein